MQIGFDLTTSSFNVRLLIMGILIAVLGATAGVSFWKLTQARNQVQNSSLIVLPEPRVIADFRLLDHHSQPFSLADLRGHWSLIFFGFTHCPDVCPGTLYDLQRVNEALEQQLGATKPRPQILFISVDPERDSPAKLEQYLAYFDPGFIGIKGDHAQLLPLTRQLGIAYRIEEHEPGAAQYGVDHSASILLTDPEGQLYGVFPAPHDAEKISADLLAVFRD